ncbi:LysR substrate-binding domain-containing protein [Variovorax sp. KK3]|uniref:LysR substrate-binding domain-containing protein n=1 Tax=Variovorax sp. KK3 TaxID=1855728 RepID=UPI00097C59F1|nr:LysR substrate-binding domain-containing protein [Variovorax sp. KK3]
MSTEPARPFQPSPFSLNHRYIEVFRAVMMRGTATEAAAMLHTSQPVVSKLLARFQSVSGIQLFELRKSRLVPTPEARILFNVIERSYIGLEQIAQTLAELRGLHSGRVQVGCLPSMGMGLLPEITRNFMKDHPTIQVAIDTVDSSLVRDGVALGRLDLGIAMRQVDSAGTEAEPLVAVHPVCVMAPGHHLAGKKSIQAKDLDGQAFIATGRNDGTRQAIERVFDDAGVRPITVAETTYAITTCMLALQGIGVGIVNPLVVAPLLKAGLVALPFKRAAPVELVLLTPLNQPPSRITQAFIQHVKLACAELPEAIRAA